MGGIKSNTTVKNIRKEFQQFGDVKRVQIMTHKDTNKKKGIAIVTFKDKDACLKAVQAGNVSVQRCSVYIKQWKPNAEMKPF